MISMRTALWLKLIRAVNWFNRSSAKWIEASVSNPFMPHEESGLGQNRLPPFTSRTGFTMWACFGSLKIRCVRSIRRLPVTVMTGSMRWSGRVQILRLDGRAILAFIICSGSVLASFIAPLAMTNRNYFNRRDKI